MGSMQMYLVLGGLLLITIFMISFYSTSSNQTSISYTNEAIISASGIGQSFIEEIQGKAFDHKTVSKVALDPDSLTAPAYLGKDIGENLVTSFNDIDDFNNFVKSDSLPKFGAFRTKAEVYYVENMNPDISSNVRTFTKVIKVIVYNDYLIDSLRIFKAIAYN